MKRGRMSKNDAILAEHWPHSPIYMRYDCIIEPPGTRLAVFFLDAKEVADVARAHPDLFEFVRYFPPRARCLDCRNWVIPDMSSGDAECLYCGSVWSLRDLIDRAAARLMQAAPNGATLYHRRRR